MHKPRPNVYKRDVRQAWYKEFGAWLVVVTMVAGLRWLYYVVVGV